MRVEVYETQSDVISALARREALETAPVPIPDGLVPRVLPAVAPNDENDVERRQRLRREHADRLARGLTELQAEVALIRAVAHLVERFDIEPFSDFSAT